MNKAFYFRHNPGGAGIDRNYAVQQLKEVFHLLEFKPDPNRPDVLVLRPDTTEIIGRITYEMIRDDHYHAIEQICVNALDQLAKIGKPQSQRDRKR